MEGRVNLNFPAAEYLLVWLKKMCMMKTHMKRAREQIYWSLFYRLMLIDSWFEINIFKIEADEVEMALKKTLEGCWAETSLPFR